MIAVWRQLEVVSNADSNGLKNAVFYWILQRRFRRFQASV
jgi:hypothetical protein